MSKQTGWGARWARFYGVCEVIGVFCGIVGVSVRDFLGLPRWFYVGLLCVSIFFLTLYPYFAQRKKPMPTKTPDRVPMPRPGPTPSEPAQPDYTTDVFGPLRWRWSWGWNRPGEWFPVDLKAFCSRPGCDFEMGWKLVPDSYRTRILYRCENPACGNLVYDPYGVEEATSFVMRLIERNWRNGTRGIPGES